MKLRLGIALALSLGAVLVVGASMSSSATSSRAVASENAVVRVERYRRSGYLAPPPGSTSPRPPASSSVLAGMVHGAIYDAVAATEGGLEPFATGVSAPPEASTDAAVARAALDVLEDARSRTGGGRADRLRRVHRDDPGGAGQGRRHRCRCCRCGRHACAAHRGSLRRCRSVRPAAARTGRVPADCSDATGRHEAAVRAPVHVLGCRSEYRPEPRTT